jgi:hypothetical protein
MRANAGDIMRAVPIQGPFSNNLGPEAPCRHVRDPFALGGKADSAEHRQSAAVDPEATSACLGSAQPLYIRGGYRPD